MLPPEVLFHRYFQTLSPAQRELYSGKIDLEFFSSDVLPAAVLVELQALWNEALNRERDGVDQPAFHFDYIESKIPNAISFTPEGYSFIGMTVPLLDRLWKVSGRVSESDA